MPDINEEIIRVQKPLDVKAVGYWYLANLLLDKV